MIGPPSLYFYYNGNNKKAQFFFRIRLFQCPWKIRGFGQLEKSWKKCKKSVDIFFALLYNNSCVTDWETKQSFSRGEKHWRLSFGVWLSLARAPGLGPGGRRFESCHPDLCGCSSMVEHQPSKLDTWVRFPSPAFHLPIWWMWANVFVAQLDRATAF